jgi:large subunit ribosomal protein L24
MKSKFSSTWKSSKQPRKQRKYIYEAPLHIKEKLISSHLSPELREKHGTRSIRIRTGDRVKILRGQNKNKEDKVVEVNLKKQKVYLEKIQTTRVDGTTVKIPFNCSNLMIIDLNLTDKKRKLKLESFKKNLKKPKVEKND